jgi:hypothetical protein
MFVGYRKDNVDFINEVKEMVLKLPNDMIEVRELKIHFPEL